MVSEGLGLAMGWFPAGNQSNHAPAAGGALGTGPDIAHSLTPRPVACHVSSAPPLSRGAGGGAFRVPAVGYAVVCG